MMAEGNTYGLFGLDEGKDEEVKAKSVNEVDINKKQCCICDSKAIKYSCPRCGFRTCSLSCVKEHKVVFDCNGIRNKVAYTRISDFTENQFYDDFSFLEEAGNKIDQSHRAQRNIVQSQMELPKWLLKLRYEARIRGTRLKFLPAGFTKRLTNKSTYMYKPKIIVWDVDWLFVTAKVDGVDLKVHENRIPETHIIQECLNQYIDPADPFEHFERTKALTPFKDLSQLSIILKTEDGLFKVNPNQTLKDILMGKTILEYPTVLVMPTTEELNYKIQNSTGPPESKESSTSQDSSSSASDSSSEEGEIP